MTDKSGEARRNLIGMLAEAGLDETTIVNITLRVRRPGGTEQMIAWLEENPGANAQQILGKAREIHRETMEQERNAAENTP